MQIKTFDNATGPNPLFKALGHPLVLAKARALIDDLARGGPVAIYDPENHFGDFAALHDISGVRIEGIFVRRAEDLGTERLGHALRPAWDLETMRARRLLIAAFDAYRVASQLQPILPAGVDILSFDALRLGEEWLSRPKAYLDTLNWATDFVFFRDAGGWHTRLVTQNYWHDHGATAPRLWCRLFDADGRVLAEEIVALPSAPAHIAIDSADWRRRFDLPEFTGSLFLHVIGAAGHDTIKYALDTYGDRPGDLSCTHDSNSWPAALYAGIPAPRPGETVTLWVQNCHPTPVSPGALGLRRMGAADWTDLPIAIPGFGTSAIDVTAACPGLVWPDQLEFRAAHHCGRPRYEITGARVPTYLAHANVERVDLKPDPVLPTLGAVLGKGYVLPISIPPVAEWASFILPTPMSTAQSNQPLALAVYDASGALLRRSSLGVIRRDANPLIELDAFLAGLALPSGHGHAELTYDFMQQEGEADGWLHGLFRYLRRADGQVADTSFGAHIYNTPVTYKREPQSYIGKPPGLSTRLFLRVAPEPIDTLCHLIYPSSKRWRGHSDTVLELRDGMGRPIANRRIAIPENGSLFWRTHAMFSVAERDAAGAGAHVMIRDTTCRLFGYHGALGPTGGFAYDHMFGF